jgi:porphyrinogen peroxidase
MLERMVLGDQEASPDFSTTATGTLFFVPTTEFLEALPDPPAGAAE